LAGQAVVCELTGRRFDQIDLNEGSMSGQRNPPKAKRRDAMAWLARQEVEKLVCGTVSVPIEEPPVNVANDLLAAPRRTDLLRVLSRALVRRNRLLIERVIVALLDRTTLTRADVRSAMRRG
jgi:hypothetical protein